MKKFMKHIGAIKWIALAITAVLYSFGVVGLGGDAATTIFGLGIPFAFGTVVSAAGSPDHTYATGSGEIPVLFADKTVEVFYDVSVAPFVANSDYEGMIKKKGDTVVINTLPDIDTPDYEVNGSINWQVLAGGKVELKVNRAKYFALRMDDVTLAQLSDKSTLDKWTKHGGERMREAIDTLFLGDVYLGAAAANIGIAAGKRSAGYNLGTTANWVSLTKGNITDYFAMCEAVGSEQSWPKTGRWMVIPTWAQYLLNTSELKEVSVTGASQSFMVNGGYLTHLYGFDIFVSNLYTPVETNAYNITFGHKSGITFAAQLTDMVHFDKFENTIGKGMRGVQVFDWKVVKPEAVGVLYAKKG